MKLSNDVSFSHHLLISATQDEDAENLLKQIFDNVEVQDPGINLVIEDEGSIGIDSIRSISSLVDKKHGDSWQTVIIKKAHMMTDESQNHLLKLLEESNKGIRFILTTSNKSELLPTVRSRLQELRYNHSHLNVENSSLAYAAGYSSSLLRRLENTDNLKNYKEWLHDSPYNRMSAVQNVSSSPQDTDILLTTVKILLFGALISATSKNQSKSQIQNLVERIELVEKTEKRIAKRGNIKLNLTYLALRI